MDPAPGSQGLSQPPPSRRALSASRCRASCCRAEPARRAVLGSKMRCAGGPPPRRARRFSTADSGQPRAPAASPGGPRPTRAPGPCRGDPVPGWTKASSGGGTCKGGESATQPLKAHRRGREPDPAPRAFYLGPIKAKVGWPLAWVQHGRSPENVGAQAFVSPLSYILHLSCELEVGIGGVEVPSGLQFHFLPPTTPHPWCQSTNRWDC